MESEAVEKRPPNSRENANYISVATFYYAKSYLEAAKSKSYTEASLPETFSEFRSSSLGDRLEEAWKNEMEKSAKLNKRPSIFIAVMKIFGIKFIIYSIVLLFSELFLVVQPTFLGWLLSYYERNQTSLTKKDAYLYSLAIGLCCLIHTMILQPYIAGIKNLGVKIRIACSSLVYRKSMRLSKAALEEVTTGKIINFVSNDISKFDYGILGINFTMVSIVETVVCGYLLYTNIGPASLYGIALILLFIPCNVILSEFMSKYKLAASIKTDERVKIISEILNGIQVIKMYAWEKPFRLLVAEERRSEMEYIKLCNLIRGIAQTFLIFGGPFITFVGVVALTLCGYSITPKNVFVMITYYNCLKMSIILFLLRNLYKTVESIVALRRLNDFLLLDEVKNSQNISTKEHHGIFKRLDDIHELSNLEAADGLINSTLSLDIYKATAAWSTSSKENTLNNINLKVRKGKLLAIVGAVGSGKSSLLNLILGELPADRGKVQVRGTVSYAAQDSWLFAGTVRQNIVFGSQLELKRYQETIAACAMLPDMRRLDKGDLTVIGDRGISLSGGQKARISLARAVYRKADIYLLDDPLSAVDKHVGKQLFHECIRGLLRDKTVILVTHQLEYLKDVDDIIYLENGSIKARGSYKELMAKGFELTILSATNEDKERKEEMEEEIRKISIKLNNIAKKTFEQISKGKTKFSVYKKYFKAGGNSCVVASFFLVFLLTQAIISALDYFIKIWVSIQLREEHESNLAKNGTSTKYLNSQTILTRNALYVYTVGFALLIIASILRLWVFVSVVTSASRKLHDNLFKKVLNAPLRFFHQNGAGRILNRFSKDTGTTDDELPETMTDTIQLLLLFLATAIILCTVNVWLIIPSGVLLIIFYILRNIYIRTARKLTRLQGSTRSPVYAHISESLHGLSTIRAFNAVDILQHEFDNHQDLQSTAWHTFHSLFSAFGYWLDVLCSIYIILVAITIVLTGDDTFGANVGFAITQAIGINSFLQWGMKQSTEMENQMISVERILEYDEIEQEREESELDIKPPPTWPNKGEIILKNVSVMYEQSLPPVLSNLNFTIQPGEKIGVVGRTGAGKSSLINAIFQMTDTKGSIIIDSVDISQITLANLRSHISIIPQEPVIFSGTMRHNLDPFNLHLDNELLDALEDAHLKETVSSLDGLNSITSSQGANLSVGQRQLLCLARAILSKNKILVLDEATANVDLQTDKLIQTTLRTKFKDCTVLTIAHRLHTVMDSDRIMILEGGYLKEFDSPENLLKNEDGLFYKLVHQTATSNQTQN